jgi:uncharacterized protein YndB with AHSA1/START domain
MTRQKSLKQRVRARMAKTGESYTAARRVLMSKGNRPATQKIRLETRFSDEKVVAATGRTWQDWFALIDKWDGERKSHTEIARWLNRERGVNGWWSQTLTVGYEQARGLREPGQRADGKWAISVSKTLTVPVKLLYEAIMDAKQREQWLPDVDLRLRTATPHKSARYDWEDGATRVNVFFDAPGTGKSRITIAHERLPDGDKTAEMKAWWRKRVAALKPLLEAGERDA